MSIMWDKQGVTARCRPRGTQMRHGRGLGVMSSWGAGGGTANSACKHILGYIIIIPTPNIQTSKQTVTYVTPLHTDTATLCTRRSRSHSHSLNALFCCPANGRHAILTEF